MKDAQRPDHISLNMLIGWLKEGRFVIPDFQREFEWRPWDINALMRSIFLDYYIGSLLLWKGKKENFNSLSCEVIYGFNNKVDPLPWNYGGGKPEYIVLDGQQRLTAMYYAFMAPNVPLPKRANRAVFFINVEKFMNEQYDEAFQYEWFNRRIKRTLNDWQVQFSQHIFPLSILGKGGWELANWVQGYEKFWQNIELEAEKIKNISRAEEAKHHAKNAKEFGKHLKSITEQYQIAYIELDRDLAVDKVCDIFTQINSRGVSLDVFDLMNALLKPKGLQLKKMWREASSRLEFADTGKMNVYVLQVMSILRQSYCSPKYLYYLLPGQEKLTRTEEGIFKKEILVHSIHDFEELWNEAVKELADSINLLRHPQEFGVSSAQYLPYVSIIPAFAALQAKCKSLPTEKRLSAQRKVRQWYWASVFLNRYSGAVESTTAKDFMDVKAWMEDMEDNDKCPSFIIEFKENFRNLDLRKETKKGTSVYNGIFNLFIIQGARDWMTGNIPQYGDLDDHHIVPVSQAVGALKDINVHTILNRTPLTAETNRKVINNQLPNKYLPKLIANSNERQICALFETHFISPIALKILLRDPFGPDDYEEFINERQHTILEAIENLLIKERLDLSPPLRELDSKIEKIELAIRKLIVSILDNNPNRLPPHISQNLKESIQRAVKKNPALDMKNYKDLSKILEFADLRQLQDIITSKTCWNYFEGFFKNKETLNTKFDQFVELRNSIRHTRTVNNIARKEGEAAILWFEQIFAKANG